MSTVDEATARPSARKPLIGAQVGLYVDMFDVYLPIIVLAPAAIYFEPDHLSATGSRILTAVVFAATLLGRPLGVHLHRCAEPRRAARARGGGCADHGGLHGGHPARPVSAGTPRC